MISAMNPPPPAPNALLINTLVNGLIADGVWSLLDTLHVLAAHSSQAALLNWKAPGTFNAVPTNSPTFTTNSGYTTDGATNYVDLAMNIATEATQYTRDSAHFSIWSPITDQVAGSIGGWFDGTDGVTLFSRNPSNTMLGRINQGTQSQTIGGSVMDGTGLFTMNRSGASALQFYHKGVALNITSNPTQASTAVNSSSLSLGRITAAGFRAYQFSAATVGASLSAPQAMSLYTRLQAYMTGLGVAG